MFIIDVEVKARPSVIRSLIRLDFVFSPIADAASCYCRILVEIVRRVSHVSKKGIPDTGPITRSIIIVYHSAKWRRISSAWVDKLHEI